MHLPSHVTIKSLAWIFVTLLGRELVFKTISNQTGGGLVLLLQCWIMQHTSLVIYIYYICISTVWDKTFCFQGDLNQVGSLLSVRGTAHFFKFSERQFSNQRWQKHRHSLVKQNYTDLCKSWRTDSKMKKYQLWNVFKERKSKPGLLVSRHTNSLCVCWCLLVR